MKNEGRERKPYLDGLRGLAALCVVSYHSSVFFSAATWTEVYGDLPNLILSRFVDRNFMVCIFFLLSGYVLAFSCTAKRDNQSICWGELLLRRYFRLTPVALVSVLFIYCIWVTVGIPNGSMTEYGPGFAYMLEEYQFVPSLADALRFGTIGMYTLPQTTYNSVLWSIAVELWGSMLLICMFALFTERKHFISMSAILSVLILAFSYYNGYLDHGVYLCLFFIGAFISLYDIRLRSRASKAVFLLVALWLGSVSLYTPEGMWLESKIAISYYSTNAVVHSIAAVLLLLTVLSSGKIQRCLSVRPLLWLGKISFSLYAIHVVVIFGIILRLFIHLEAAWGIRLAAAVCYVTIFILSLLLAAFCTKFVDLPSQRLAKWAAHRLLPASGEASANTGAGDAKPAPDTDLGKGPVFTPPDAKKPVGIFAKLKKNRFLFQQLVHRDFTHKYKRAVLGMWWSALSPLLTLLVMYIVFATLLGSDIEYYTIYLFSGQLVFSFFNESTNEGMTSLLNNADIFTKVNIPKYMFLLSKNVSSLINFLITLCVYFIFVAASGIQYTWKFVMLIYPISCLVVFNLGVGLILSALYVFFRDVQYLYSIFTMLLMYISAIFYSIDTFPQIGRNLFLLNPIYVYIRYFRKIVIEGTIPSVWFHLIAAGYAVIAFGIGFLIYKKKNHSFLYYV